MFVVTNGKIGFGAGTALSSPVHLFSSKAAAQGVVDRLKALGCSDFNVVEITQAWDFLRSLEDERREG